MRLENRSNNCIKTCKEPKRRKNHQLCRAIYKNLRISLIALEEAQTKILQRSKKNRQLQLMQKKLDYF